MNFTKMPNRMKIKDIDRTKLIPKPDPKDTEKKYTPKEVVDNMLEILPKELWHNPEAIFLDICCKSGIFLECIFWKLYEGLRERYTKDWERSNYILENQLFGLALNEELAGITRGLLYGCSKANHKNAFISTFEDEEGKIKVLKRTVDIYTNGYREVINDAGLFKDTIEEAFGDMKFDVVIGNPPYNKGMDLDFVKLGFDLCEKYCVMITPAKWQTAADDYSGCASKTIDYKGFREQLVHHMSYVCFYPDSFDVFGAAQTDGISYYLLDKQTKYDKCKVENRCLLQNRFNSIEIRAIKNRETLYNVGNEIINYLKNCTTWKFKNIQNRKYEVWTNNQVPVAGGRIKSGGGASDGGGNGGCLLSLDGKCLIVGVSRIIDVSSGERSIVGASNYTFSSDDKSDCESFVSWLNTKFTRFFVEINISKLTGILTDDYFRFVPAPPSGKFDHIYTDEELYKAFNLPQKYIDVIEAVIKERK